MRRHLKNTFTLVPASECQAMFKEERPFCTACFAAVDEGFLSLFCPQPEPLPHKPGSIKARPHIPAAHAPWRLGPPGLQLPEAPARSRYSLPCVASADWCRPWAPHESPPVIGGGGDGGGPSRRLSGGGPGVAVVWPLGP